MPADKDHLRMSDLGFLTEEIGRKLNTNQGRVRFGEIVGIRTAEGRVPYCSVKLAGSPADKPLMLPSIYPGELCVGLQVAVLWDEPHQSYVLSAMGDPCSEEGEDDAIGTWGQVNLLGTVPLTSGAEQITGFTLAEATTDFEDWFTPSANGFTCVQRCMFTADYHFAITNYATVPTYSETWLKLPTLVNAFGGLSQDQAVDQGNILVSGGGSIAVEAGADVELWNYMGQDRDAGQVYLTLTVKGSGVGGSVT